MTISIEAQSLKTCPFCGGEAYLGTVRYGDKTVREQEWSQNTFFKVNCITCGSNNLSVVGYASEEDAAAHWNRRALTLPPLPVGGEKGSSQDHEQTVTAVTSGGCTIPPKDWIYEQARRLSTRKDQNSVGALAWNMLIAFTRWADQSGSEATDAAQPERASSRDEHVQDRPTSLEGER